MTEHILNTAVWGDGSGTTLEATLRAIHEGVVDFEVDTVFTSDGKAGILDVVAHANNHLGMDIKPVVLTKSRVNHWQTPEAEEQFLNLAGANNVKNVMLMGSLVIMGADAVRHFNGIVPEQPLPHTLEEAKKLMMPTASFYEYQLPASFPDIVYTGRYGLMNAHPAPTIVTANTYGQAASRRMIDLRSIESAVTFHAVAPEIDTGPIAAAHKFSVDLPSPNADEATKDDAAKKLFRWAQRVEKATLPLDVEIHLKNRQDYLNAA